MACDLGDVTRGPEDVVQQVHQWVEEDSSCTLSLVVLCAGVVSAGPLQDAQQKELQHMITVNFASTVCLTQLVLPLLGDGSKLVLIASDLAKFSIPGKAVYSATKAALLSFAGGVFEDVR